MSRIGNAPLTIPGGVTLTQSGDAIVVKGPLGEMKASLPKGIGLQVEGNTAKITRTDDSREQKERHGLIRALVNNNLAGVSTGWKKNIELVGVGYRVQLKGNDLVFSLGYSHEVKFQVPQGIKAQVADQTKLEISGIDKQLVGQVASNIRSLRPPEPYKGKGVKYADEVIRRKAGKTGKAGKGK